MLGGLAAGVATPAIGVDDHGQGFAGFRGGDFEGELERLLGRQRRGR